MTEFPSFPLYADSYWADTHELSAEQHGIYLNLLMLTWRQPDGTLPGDVDFISSFCKKMFGMHGRSFNAKVMPILNKFFEYSDGRYIQKRILKEREKRLKNTRKDAENLPKRVPDSKENKELDLFGEFVPSPSPSPNKKEGLSAPLETEIFRFGKDLLGQRNLWVVKQLRDLMEDPQVMRCLELAQPKGNRFRYLMAIVNNKKKEAAARAQAPDWFDDRIHVMADDGTVLIKADGAVAQGPC